MGYVFLFPDSDCQFACKGEKFQCVLLSQGKEITFELTATLPV